MFKESTKRYKRFVGLVCVGVMLLTSIPVFAEPSVTDIQDQKTSLESQLSSIHTEIVTLDDEITALNSKIEVTESEIARTEAELAKSKEEEQAQYNSMKSRIKYMYEEGNSTLLELLVHAEDMGDFLNKTEFIQNITDYDREMLNQFQAIVDHIEEQENTLKGEQAALTDLKSQGETKQIELQAKAEATSTDLAAVQTQLEEARQKEAAAELAKEVNDNPYSGNADELETFAALLDCEAISDYDSMMAVATVIMNRVNSSKYSNSIKGVIYAEGQFEPTWTGKLERRLEAGASSLARQVAQDAMNGARSSKVRYCFYFLYAPSTSRQGTLVGDNLFFVKW